MKQIIYTIAITLFANIVFARGNANELNKKLRTSEISFTENKGQIHDQNNMPRADVLYGVTAGNMAVHIKKSGVSYQLYRIDSRKEVVDFKTNKLHQEIDKQTIYRVDLNWVNANNNFTQINDDALPGFNNYYFDNCPNGALNVKSYKGVSLNNLYAGINLHYYEKDGELKHDYIVAPHADYKKIQLKIDGAEVKINSDGTLLLITPLGKIQEGAPIVFQDGKQLNAKWKLSKNILSFEIEKYNPELELVIDPITRLWGTYYGGTGSDIGYSCSTDATGNVYLAGTTDISATGTIIATTGSHQTTYSGGTTDAFLVKFDTEGVRQWGTYYGGNSNEGAYSCSTDQLGNIYITGQTQTSTSAVFATSGCHQASYLGGGDAYLAKFNSAGVRQWSTYYGDTGLDYANNCSTDASGNVYIAGYTSSNGVLIPSSGAHQTTYGGGTYDAFIVKFNSAGTRQWGTYYGGTNLDNAKSCTVDASGNVFLVGYTSSTVSIATGGSHKPTKSIGGEDAFLIKFNSSGIRQWGTYYGGNGVDKIHSCITDASGDIYIAGETTSSGGTVVATSSSHQSIHGGSTDAFLAKFNTAGIRQWGTYYGGTGDDYGYSCAIDGKGNIYMSGYTTTSSASIIAAIGAFQGVYGGMNDAFLSKFDSNGSRLYATYYGGTANDVGYSMAVDNNENMFMAGYANSGTGNEIATAGSHQSTIGGANDAFLVKIGDCTPPNPTNTTSGTNQTICDGNNTTLSASSGSNLINWYATSSSSTILATGNTYTTSVLSTGTYTYYAEASGCVNSISRTAIVVSVNSLPTISVNSGSICSGNSFTITPSGANTYTISGGSSIVTPTSNATYSVTGTSSQGCTSSNTAISSVIVNASPTISVNSGSICSGNSFTITPSGANTYTISGGSSIVTPTSNATYSVTGTSSQGCTSSNTAISSVTVNALPTISVNSGAICTGSSFTISPSGASTYTYSSGSAIVSPTTNTSYSVTGTSAAGCLSSNTAVSSVTVNALPTISVNSGTICSGNSFTITPTGANTYTVSGGSFVVSPSTSTNYTVTGTSSNGCVGSTGAVSNVNVNSLPTISVSTSNTLLCTGQTATLSASGASTYTWSNSQNTANIAISPVTTTSYTLSGTDANGCKNSTVITQSVSSCTGLQNLNNDFEINIYPNPTNGKFTINLPVECDIEVIDMLGSVISKHSNISGIQSIDISNYANGLYFIKFKTLNNQYAIKRIIKN